MQDIAQAFGRTTHRLVVEGEELVRRLGRLLLVEPSSSRSSSARIPGRSSALVVGGASDIGQDT